jgi:hypothetical protein
MRLLIALRDCLYRALMLGGAGVTHARWHRMAVARVAHRLC